MSANDFRATPPPPSPPRPYHFPDVERFTLDNGLRVLVARRHEAPLLTVRAVVHAGADHDTPDLPGLATLTAEMLEEGAAGRSAMDIAGEMADLGGSLFTGADWDASFVSLDALSRHLEAGLRMVADLLLRPDFPAKELERVRRERLTALLQQKDEPAAVAGNLFSRVLYGEAPYGNPASGNEASVAAITREQVLGFYGRHFAPNNTSLLVTGDVDPGRVRELVGQRFGTWERKPRAVHAPPESGQLDVSRIYLIDRPASVQSEIRIGHVGAPRASEDYFPLVVMNAVLGGVFTSRLNLNLREKHGYTYGIRSSFSFRRWAGPFVVSTAVRNEVTMEAVREIVLELQAIREGRMQDEELATARDYLQGVFPATVQSAHDLASRLQEMELYDLPVTYFDHYREMLGAVTAEDVQRVAMKYVDPDRLAIVVVGRASDIHEPLESLRHPIGLYDLEGKAVVT